MHVLLFEHQDWLEPTQHKGMQIPYLPHISCNCASSLGRHRLPVHNSVACWDLELKPTPKFCTPRTCFSCTTGCTGPASAGAVGSLVSACTCSPCQQTFASFRVSEACCVTQLIPAPQACYELISRLCFAFWRVVNMGTLRVPHMMCCNDKC